MTIDVHFNASTVIDLHAEMRALLEGDRRATSTVVTGNTGSAGTDPIAPNKDKPASGRTRQTAADKAAAAASTVQGISTGEERTDPETDKQDAKDEASDTATQATAVVFTHDSVRKMLGGYVQAYGMEAAQEDGVKIFVALIEKGFATKPEEGKISKTSDIKSDQKSLATAVIDLANAIEKNPYNREIAGDGITAEKLADLKPLVTAAVAAVK